MTDEKHVCVIGWPISHSRSPLIHNYWIKKYGVRGTYGREAVTVEDFPEFFSTLGKRGYSGANITVPHKETAFRLTKEVDEMAVAMGAVNTVWFSGDRVEGTNTDSYGFLTNLDYAAPTWLQDSGPAVILGAGGAARAVLYGLLERGIREIFLINRTREKAESLAKIFDGNIVICDWEDRSRILSGARLLINSTSLGMEGMPELEIDLGSMAKNAVVMDIVYVPLETKLLRQARRIGYTAVDGLGMLLYQAVPAFKKWFGVKPNVTSELRALIESDLRAQVSKC